MDKYTNALEVLQRLPFGSMIYDVISIDGIVWELSLFGELPPLIEVAASWSR